MEKLKLMHRMLFMALVLAVFVLSCYSFSFADTVYLKSGNKVEGKIIEKSDDYLKVDIAGVAVTYFWDEIESAQLDDGKKIYPKEKPEAAEKKPLAEEPGFKKPAKEEKMLSAPGVAGTAEDVEKILRLKPPKIPYSPFYLGVIFFIFILTYAFFAYCLQLIASKTQVENRWFAWVPILNLILMCDIAQKPRWWAALFLLSIIPIVGPIITMVISAILWMKIAEKRGRPAWLGILTVLPLVNFFIYGYLAFTD
jgi:hypothetical protein